MISTEDRGERRSFLRFQVALRLRREGWSMREIGERLSVCATEASRIVDRARGLEREILSEYGDGSGVAVASDRTYPPFSIRKVSR